MVALAASVASAPSFVSPLRLHDHGGAREWWKGEGRWGATVARNRRPHRPSWHLRPAPLSDRGAAGQVAPGVVRDQAITGGSWAALDRPRWVKAPASLVSAKAVGTISTPSSRISAGRR